MITRFIGPYAFLSNFYSCPVPYERQIFPSVEHFFQAMKSLDPIDRLTVLRARSPAKAKMIGKLLHLREDWEQIKEQVMLLGLRKKFYREDLGRMLLSTKDATLVEGNTWGDTYWGVDLRTNVGRNRLGILLMQVRDELHMDKKVELMETF